MYNLRKSHMQNNGEARLGLVTYYYDTQADKKRFTIDGTAQLFYIRFIYVIDL